MKKIIFIIIIVLTIYFIKGKVNGLVIPDDAIRIRVIANSNSEYDQYVKEKVKDVVQVEMYEMLKLTKGSNQAREIIQNNLNNIENKIFFTLQTLNYNLGYDVNYGLNYFPSKEYKGVSYKDGYYESLVITLGEGKGDNWWCVLFPPLCLLEASESDNVEYDFFIKELINKYL